jgi:uncharacterized DUF497 family protein
LRKHGVSFEEAATVFSDPGGLDWEDFDHSLSERRSTKGRFLRGRASPFCGLHDPEAEK